MHYAFYSTVLCVDKAAWQRKKDIGNEEVEYMYVTVYTICFIHCAYTFVLYCTYNVTLTSVLDLIVRINVIFYCCKEFNVIMR